MAEVRGIDKVLARKTGLQYHIDLHIKVDSMLTVAASTRLLDTSGRR